MRTDTDTAVSYTHLDVYKRQAVKGPNFPQKISISAHNFEKKYQGNRWEAITTNLHPVSYTHLTTDSAYMLLYYQFQHFYLHNMKQNFRTDFDEEVSYKTNKYFNEICNQQMS